MASITVTLSDLQLEKIKDRAQQLEISLEDCVKISIDNWLTDVQPDFAQAAAYVLKKNCEIYRRLA